VCDALSLILGEAKLTAEHMETKADVTLEKQSDGFAITAVHLILKAKVPGAHETKFASALMAYFHDALSPRNSHFQSGSHQMTSEISQAMKMTDAKAAKIPR